MPVSPQPTPTGRPWAAHERERGDIISSWLIKLTVTLALLGVVAYDGLSLLTTEIGLSDQAASSARAAVEAVETGGIQKAYPAAQTRALEQNVSNDVAPADVQVLRDGSVTVTVHRTAITLILHRLGPLADWADRGATITAHPPG